MWDSCTIYTQDKDSCTIRTQVKNRRFLYYLHAGLTHEILVLSAHRTKTRDSCTNCTQDKKQEDSCTNCTQDKTIHQTSWTTMTKRRMNKHGRTAPKVIQGHLQVNWNHPLNCTTALYSTRQITSLESLLPAVSLVQISSLFVYGFSFPRPFHTSTYRYWWEKWQKNWSSQLLTTTHYHSCIKVSSVRFMYHSCIKVSSVLFRYHSDIKVCSVLFRYHSHIKVCSVLFRYHSHIKVSSVLFRYHSHIKVCSVAGKSASEVITDLCTLSQTSGF